MQCFNIFISFCILQEGEDDEGWEDDGEGADDVDDNGVGVYTSDLLKDCNDLIDDEIDPDALTDPLNNVELQPYLTNFISTFAQHPAYAMFAVHLNSHEVDVLSNIRVSQ